MDRPPPTPRVKVCGLTRLEDARHAVEHGAWALGMIFWPGSARVVDLGEARRISRELRRRALIAGVFVDATLDEIALVAEDVPLGMVQLHGDEGPAFAQEVARRTGAKVVKAIRVRTQADVVRAEAFRTDFHLLDTHVEGLPGGTGQTFDWGAVKARRSKVPLVLSGGLTPDNVAGAVAAVRPFAVDVASGVEAAPGVKDHAKVEAFLAAARGPEPAAAPEPEPERPRPVRPPADSEVTA